MAIGVKGFQPLAGESEDGHHQIYPEKANEEIKNTQQPDCDRKAI
jgi:hypothetical protein